MAVLNSGSGVVVDASGVTLAGFTNAAASNIKIQDGTLYAITSNAVGGAANGTISLPSTNGAIATLDSNHTFLCTKTELTTGAAGADANAALSLKGAKLVFTSDAGNSEGTVPIIGDAQTQVIYRANGTTWNSVQAGVKIDSSTFIFLGGGDGHLGSHPSATVKSPVLLWKSTSPNVFVLAGNQAWATSGNKPIAMDGFSFTSVSGNNLISMFTINVTTVSGGKPNNYFFVCKDWTYNVALPNTRPDALRRSYRRTNVTASASSYWGAVSICPTYLHIDLKTTLSASGVLNSAPTYLRSISYNEAGVGGGDNSVDVLTLRFAPTVTDPLGTKLSDCSIVVQNTNSNCSSANAIGNFRARLAASGVTDSTGKIVITEPSTKDYTSNSSHRTDSAVIRNRTLTTAWNKWWEAGVKLIPIADSRNGVGATAPESYAATDYTVSYRRAGSQFSSASLNMAEPQMASVALTSDANYNSAATTTGITVSYAIGITTVALENGTYTADSIWKAVIDFHASPSNNEAESIPPFTAWTAGEMRFGSNLLIVGSASAIITAGTKVKSLISSKAEGFNTAGNPTVTATLEDANGVRVTVTKLGGGVFNIAAQYGTTSYTKLGFQSGVSTVTYTVPKGQPVEVVMWSLGYETYKRSISTVDGGVAFVAEMTAEPTIDTTLDVSSYLSNIALSLDTTGASPQMVATFNAPMTVSGIELGKAITHKLVGQQTALESCFPIGSATSLDIKSDEVMVNLPSVRLEIGSALQKNDNVYLRFFFNTAPALAIDPAFVLNPPRDIDGKQVQVSFEKPAIDISQLVAGMVSSGIATSSNVAAIPTVVKTLVEASGGKLDIAMKAAKAAKRQTQ